MITNEKRVIVALDNMSLAEAAAMTALLKDEAAGVKVGFELLSDEGAKNIMTALQPHGVPVFFDPKLHDIPNTAEKAATKLARRGAWIINLHCSGGVKMMSAVRKAVDEIWEKEREALGLTRKPLVIGVTVLTSLDYDQLDQVVFPVLGLAASVLGPQTADEKKHCIQEIALKMARLAASCGLDGVVCSPLETVSIRRATADYPSFQIINPGIRSASSAKDDQERISTPSGAIIAGANWLVVGRPVTADPDPKAALQAINGEVNAALVAIEEKGQVAA